MGLNDLGFLCFRFFLRSFPENLKVFGVAVGESSVGYFDEGERLPNEDANIISPDTGMSSLRNQMYFMILDLKSVRIQKEKRVEITRFLFEMLQHGAKDDVHGFKSNITMTQEEVKRVLKAKQLKPAIPAIAKKLGQIYNALYNLGAGYYVDFYLDYGVENDGPYDVSEMYGPGHILVIKRVIGMKPVELFPESKDFLGSHITIYTVYKDVKYTTNLVSVHSTYEGDTINGLKYWGMDVDGRMVDEHELSERFEKSAQASIEQWQRLTSLSFEEQKIKAAEIRGFGMRKLFEKGGMDWKPSQKMLDTLKGKPFKDNLYWKIPEDEKKKKEYWKKMYDPREDFYPGDCVD